MSLNLNISLYSLEKPLSQFLDQVSKIKDNHSKLSEIDGYVGKLEDERKKIDVFKRELPLCMLLLNEAIERLKEEASSVMMASNGRFDVGQGAKSESDNKKNWMSSAQLWISNSNSTNREEDRGVTQTPFQTCYNLNQRGVFMPFNPPPVPLSLMTPPPSDMMMRDCSRIEQNHQLNRPLQSHHHHIPKKEQRRRWSQDLHRRFVDALQRIGGSQVATPKQIRDEMKVDGLTNDEVKSHLQKYRMHIRKHPGKTLLSLDQPGLLGRETQSLISLSRSDSPQSPLVGRELFSNNGGGHSSEDEEEEEKSDGRSWKSESDKKRQVLNLEL
ncbi:Homeodomain-like superfamily protein [Raphanus sativus]|nr:Homeodomain-like superfamily protein [Raphanus sativus]KAJ4873800.1 Homeodomain-like superfamily protein [Raphanus sativus]KAJ4880238.1 Homeodomain-like superfamily protein [Raphanus sativus]